MSSRLLNADQMDPAFSLFRIELSLLTCLHEPTFKKWLEANLFELAFEFYCDDEPEPDPACVEATFEIWARRRFLEERVTA